MALSWRVCFKKHHFTKLEVAGTNPVSTELSQTYKGEKNCKGEFF